MTTDYEIMLKQAKELVDGVPHFIANLANISALLFETLEDINWAGFYLREGEKLVLGPFQGKPACIEIASGKGVCGTAMQLDCIQRIANVHEFAGHIACDSASNSEIVIPIHGCDTGILTQDPLKNCSGEEENGEKASLPEKKVVAVLDIDSTEFSRFTEEDEEGLRRLVRLLEESVFS